MRPHIRRKLHELGLEAPNKGSWSRRIASALDVASLPEEEKRGSWDRRAFYATGEEPTGTGSWKTRLRKTLVHYSPSSPFVFVSPPDAIVDERGDWDWGTGTDPEVTPGTPGRVVGEYDEHDDPALGDPGPPTPVVVESPWYDDHENRPSLPRINVPEGRVAVNLRFRREVQASKGPSSSRDISYATFRPIDGVAVVARGPGDPIHWWWQDGYSDPGLSTVEGWGGSADFDFTVNYANPSATSSWRISVTISQADCDEWGNRWYLGRACTGASSFASSWSSLNSSNSMSGPYYNCTGTSHNEGGTLERLAVWPRSTAYSDHIMATYGMWPSQYHFGTAHYTKLEPQPAFGGDPAATATITVELDCEDIVTQAVTTRVFTSAPYEPTDSPSVIPAAECLPGERIVDIRVYREAPGVAPLSLSYEEAIPV